MNPSTAAETLQKEGINLELIDLRSISPWDKATVFESVAKTHRLVIAHEAVKSFGIGAELAATVAEEIIDELDAPIVRVGAPFVPVPFSLEKAYLPDSADVISAVKRTLATNLYRRVEVTHEGCGMVQKRGCQGGRHFRNLSPVLGKSS